MLDVRCSQPFPNRAPFRVFRVFRGSKIPSSKLLKTGRGYVLDPDKKFI
jgi:hypothetical protein